MDRTFCSQRSGTHSSRSTGARLRYPVALNATTGPVDTLTPNAIKVPGQELTNRDI